MAKTDNITRYECDRCHQAAHLTGDDPRRSDWRQVRRYTSDGVESERLLCSACYRDYRPLVVGQDNDFNRWMIQAPADEKSKEDQI